MPFAFALKGGSKVADYTPFLQRNNTLAVPRLPISRPVLVKMDPTVAKEQFEESSGSSGAQPPNNTNTNTKCTPATDSDKAPRYVAAFHAAIQRADDAVVGWSLNGDKVIVRDVDRLEKLALTLPGGSRKWDAFKRQMNYYKFTKLREEDVDDALRAELAGQPLGGGRECAHVFVHRFFVRGEIDLVKNIRSVTTMNTPAKRRSSPKGGTTTRKVPGTAGRVPSCSTQHESSVKEDEIAWLKQELQRRAMEHSMEIERKNIEINGYQEVIRDLRKKRRRCDGDDDYGDPREAKLYRPTSDDSYCGGLTPTSDDDWIDSSIWEADMTEDEFSAFVTDAFRVSKDEDEDGCVTPPSPTSALDLQ